MPRFKLVSCLVFGLMLVACGGGNDSEPGADGERADPAPALPVDGDGSTLSDPGSTACADGGTACPGGLECLTWRDGNRACGPLPAPAAVLIRDFTLGGSCLTPDPADTHPGVSIASMQIIGVDGNVQGFGRMAWEKAGFEVAAERGSPPGSSEFVGDACTDAYNIGCDGQAVFEIVDPAGKARMLRAGEMIILQLRGQDACGEQVPDEVAAAICSEPEAAASGDLASCASRVRMVEARSDQYGPDRQVGTIGDFKTR